MVSAKKVMYPNFINKLGVIFNYLFFLFFALKEFSRVFRFHFKIEVADILTLSVTFPIMNLNLTDLSHSTLCAC